MITKGIKDLCFEAEKQIETLSVDQVMQENADPEVLLVDIRDIRELWREGTIPGSIHAPRGMLEFWVDPESPYHRKDFSSGKGGNVISFLIEHEQYTYPEALIFLAKLIFC